MNLFNTILGCCLVLCVLEAFVVSSNFIVNLETYQLLMFFHYEVQLI